MSDKQPSAKKELKGREHSINSAMQSLSKKRVHFIDHKGMVLIDLERAEPLGNKSWGKIDYLIKKASMRINMVTKHLYDRQFN